MEENEINASISWVNLILLSLITLESIIKLTSIDASNDRSPAEFSEEFSH